MIYSLSLFLFSNSSLINKMIFIYTFIDCLKYIEH